MPASDELSKEARFLDSIGNRTRPNLMPAMGMGLWWAWFLSLFFADVGVNGETIVGTQTAAFLKIGLMVGYAAAALACLLPRVTNVFATNDPFRLVSLALVQSLASVVDMLAGGGLGGRALVMASTLLASLGAGIMLLLWAALFSRFGALSSGMLFAGATAAGGALWLVFRLVAIYSSVAYWLLVALIPSIELAIYLIIARRTSETAPLTRDPTQPERRMRPTPVFASFGVAYGLLFGLIDVIAFWGWGDEGDIGAISPSLAAVAGLTLSGVWIYVYISRVKTEYIDYSRALRIPLILVALGYALLVFGGTRWLLLAEGVAILGYLAFWQLYNAVWIEISIRSETNVFITSAWGFAISASSIAIGAVVGFVIISTLGNTTDPDHVLEVVGIAAVFGLLVATMLLMDSSKYADLGGMVTITEPPASADALADRVGIVADRHGLTPREREVALLIARGRNVRRIQDELVISAGTARTHLHHIYEKCGVHSDQELIDLIEEASPDNR